MVGSIEDRFAVMEVALGYSGAASRLSAEALSSFFADDAIMRGIAPLLGRGDGDLVGPQQVREGFAPVFAQLEFLQQLPSFVAVSVQGDRATAEVLVTEFTRRKNGGKMMMVCAKYDDEYKKTSVGWKFAKRTFSAKTLTVLSELPFTEA
jgi:hypothetical protein